MSTTNVLENAGPTVAGQVPRKFHSSLTETSLKDAEFLRLPPPRARDPLTGLSRTSLVELGDRGVIKMIRVRKPGAVRGICLIEKESLLSYLRSLASAVPT